MVDLNVYDLKEHLEKRISKEILAYTQKDIITFTCDQLFKLEFSNKDNIFLIQNFHTYKRECGYGRKIINALRDYLSINMFDYIKLIEINPDSLGFWQKLGAYYYDENDYLIDI